MGTAHEETGHGHADRRTTQSTVKIGEAAGRRAPVTPRPVSSEPVAAALPPRVRFDSQEWLNSRQPSRRSVWMKRGGAVLVAGLFGCLGWVGYQQMPKPAAAATESGEEFVLDGETAESLAAPPASATSNPKIASADVEASPFEQPAAFRRLPAPVERVDEPVAEAAANPFAAFARPATQTAMAADEDSFARPPEQPAAESKAAVVTLASNESTEPPAAVEIFEVDGQSEPAAEATPPAQVELAPPAGKDDPFAGFAPQSSPELDAASSVPAAFGGTVQSEPVPDAQPVSPKSPQPVAQVQFNPDPAAIEPPAQFEPEARPIDSANAFAAEPAPALNRAPAQPDWSGFEQHQPAAVEPSKTAASRPAYSPVVERAEPTGFNVPQPAAAANDPRDEKLHVVQQGETYWSIARQHYGAGRYFQALAEYNKPRISDQQSLKPGMKVLVPSATTLDTRYGKLMQASGHAKPPAKPQSGLRFDPQGAPYYIVGEGDTLGEIATRHLGKTLRSEEIYRMNQEQLRNPNSLKAGTILLMPADASEVQAASSAFRGR
jgi:nucleoid-associated protein YgaU